MVRDKRSSTTTKNNYKQQLDLSHYGLVNLGNSCFYNSIIQSLSVTRPLLNLINSPPNSSPLLSSLQSKTTNDLIDSIIIETPIPLSTAFVNLLGRLKLTQSPTGKKTLNPSELLRVLARKHEEYSGKSQEDSHELLRMLLDGMNMEEFDVIKKLNSPVITLDKSTTTTIPRSLSTKKRRMTIVPTKPSLKISSPDENGNEVGSKDIGVHVEDGDDEQSDEDIFESDELSEGEVKEEEEEDSSESSSDSEDEARRRKKLKEEVNDENSEKIKFKPFVETVFGGKLESFIVCDTCQHVSLSTEDFLDLSLSLKEDPTIRIRKRDRFRKSLQSSFFSSSSSSKPSSSNSNSSQSPSPTPTTSTSSRALLSPTSTSSKSIRSNLSLSETDGSSISASGSGEGTSASEAESESGAGRREVLTDDDRIIKLKLRNPIMDEVSTSTSTGIGGGSGGGGGGGRGLGRSQSLDPKTHLSKKTFWSSSNSNGGVENGNGNGSGHNRSNSSGSGIHEPSHLNPAFSSTSSNNSNNSNNNEITNTNSLSRSSSPLGRALSSLTSSKSGKLSNSSTTSSSKSKSTSKIKSSRKPKIPKPTIEQLNYVKMILKDIPSASSSTNGSNSVVGQLRWTMPDRSVGPSVGGGNGGNGGGGAGGGGKVNEQVGTDLYDCLISFTAVENLEGENSFQCHNCWKLLNPDSVDLIKEERLERRTNKQIRRSIKSINGRKRSSTISNSNGGGDNLPVSPAVLDFAPDLDLEELDLNDEASTPKSTSISALTDEEASRNGDADEEDSGNVTDTSTSKSIIKIIPPTPTTAPLTIANVDSLTAPSTTSTTVTKNNLFSSSYSSSSKKDSSTHSLASTTSSPSLSAPNSKSLNPLIPTSPSPTITIPPKSARHILRTARKRYLISPNNLPPVLVIQFKRFQQSQSTKSSSFFGVGGGSGRNSGTPFTSLKKRDDLLSFSLRLDLYDFLAPVGKGSQQSSSSTSDRGRGRAESVGKGVDEKKEKDEEGKEKKESAIYELYSVICHSGSLKEGHYISYILSDMFSEKIKRGLSISEEEKKVVIDLEKEQEENEEGEDKPRMWLYSSDTEVRMSSVEEVLKSKAYMLFYEKISSSSNSSNSSNISGNDQSSTVFRSHI